MSSPPTRRHRARRSQIFVLAASAVFIVMAVLARTMPYFPIDLAVTRGIQGDHGILFDRLMRGLSWLGFSPQVAVLGAVTIVAIYFLGLRWEAVATAFAACGVAIGSLTKLIVMRPRPTADIVQVAYPIGASSFPSGHVLMFTTFCGFLAFLAFTLLKPSWGRNTLTAVLILIVVLMGPSRMYLGQHWFSDVMGAYVLGALWLALTIRFYRWGKTRFFVRQPVAPEVPHPKPAEATS